MSDRPLRRYPATVFLLLTLLACVPRIDRPAQRSTPPLLVVLVVDQMRADYIDSYRHQWSQGLHRLLEEGAWFRQAAYPFRSTVTCAGHATIATGSFPAPHGMIQNTWWDRDSKQRVTCTTDARAEPIGYGRPALERHSPSTLASQTLADALRLQAAHRPRVVSISLKPRSAITLAGHGADAVVWFDAASTWATSSAYTDGPVAVVQSFIDTNPMEVETNGTWTRLLTPESYLHDDHGFGERPAASWEVAFPHPLGDTMTDDSQAPVPGNDQTPITYERWRTSPYSDAYVARMALALVDAFALGQGDGTDYLAIGFSALDLVGHNFGPRSHEVQDVLARLDGTIGTFLAALDERVGPGAYLVALTSDHGVSPIPEYATTQGLEAGRIQADEIVEKIETLLTDRLGPGTYVADLSGGDVYFEPGVYDVLHKRPGDLEAVIELIGGVPGIWRIYRSEELYHAINDNPVTRAASLSYYRGRSGDLILIPKPHWLTGTLAANHGTPHHYDTRVPVILFGQGIRPGAYLAPLTPADIAPTLASLAGITLPQSDGRILIEALERPTRTGTVNAPDGTN